VSEQALTKKTLAVVLLGVLGLLGLGAAGLLYVGSRLTQFVTEPTWGPDAVPRRDLSRVFGVRLPPGATAVVSRSSGFQDPFLEALARLPDGGAEAFLETNGLRVSAEAAEQNPDAEDELRVLVPQAQHITAVGLEGLADLTTGDAGAVALYRHAVLFTVDGASWVYLVAVGT
jgi:hypothetical protein